MFVVHSLIAALMAFAIQLTPPAKADTTDPAVKDFIERAGHYWDLHKKMEGAAPRINKKKDDPEDLIAHIECALAAVPAVTTMVREGYTPQEMLQRALGGLPLQVLRHMTPLWACHGSRVRVSQTLLALGTDELRQLVAGQQGAQVHCEFCTTAYRFEPQELGHLLGEALAAEQSTS